MNIMTALFDQDYVTRMYGVDQRREGREEGKREGKREGRREGRKDTAKSLKKAGMTIDFIEKHTGLSKDEILKL